MRRLREWLQVFRSRSIEDLVVVAMILLPLGALALVAYNFTVVSTPDLLPVWAAILIGVVLGDGILMFGVYISGTDAMDLIVTSLQIIVVMLLLLPVAPGVKAQRLRRKQQPALVRMQSHLPARLTRVARASSSTVGSVRVRG